MDIAKFIFNMIDVTFDKKQNKRIKLKNAEDVIITKDVLYSASDPKICRLDYYYVPQKKGLYPVMFNIHGGGFMAGDKEYRRALCTWHALNGFFVVNVNYGLCPECNFPTPVLQLAAALNHVNRFAKLLRLDLDKMVVTGDSAGGYYAAMLAALCANEDMQKALKVKTRVKFGAAILNCGLYDLDTVIKRRLLFDLNKKVFDSYIGIDEDAFLGSEYKDLCSPLPFINKDFPPCFLVYADKDIFCGGQTEILTQKLDSLDIYYESYHSVSMLRNHCFSLEWTSREAKDANALIEKFLDKFKRSNLPPHMSEATEIIRECEKDGSDEPQKPTSPKRARA